MATKRSKYIGNAMIVYLFIYFRRGMNSTTSKAFRFSHKNNFSLKNTKNCSSLMLKLTSTPTSCGKKERRIITSTPRTSRTLWTWITVI